MIKKYLGKAIALSMLVTSVLTLNPIGASAEWKSNSTGWWYTEGNSYAKNCWSLIDGNWYYFDYNGYMLHDTIIDGYYLNSNGVYINEPSEEIKKYESLLKDKDWIKKTTNKSSIYSNIISDINQDGVSEMLLPVNEGSFIGVLYMIAYSNGNVNVDSVRIPSNGQYSGYSSSEKVFFVSGMNGGSRYVVGYKLENNMCKEVYSYYDNSGLLGSRGATVYSINGQDVSKEEYYDSLQKLYKKLDSTGQNIIPQLMEVY